MFANFIRPTLNYVRRLPASHFHTTSVIRTGKILVATNETFKELVLDANEPVIVDFYADWCGPCKLLTPILERVVKDNKRVTLVKVDADANQQVTDKYEITGLPTVFCFHKGKPKVHFIGVKSEGHIKDFVEQASALADH
ncbi:6861_t:CDS:2 [Acaulospora morrowiae]|uniref:6861_t:CDS:1 n=1 Tax=Acaulospora morrowiae TaxID=94023 RepID=A0A9N8WEU5_9GLOM|nr:6861_t:CDS:2 [Acaulospora morrowiae]